jgi:hypothetical protein
MALHGERAQLRTNLFKCPLWSTYPLKYVLEQDTQSALLAFIPLFLSTLVRFDFFRACIAQLNIIASREDWRNLRGAASLDQLLRPLVKVKPLRC